MEKSTPARPHIRLITGFGSSSGIAKHADRVCPEVSKEVHPRRIKAIMGRKFALSRADVTETYTILRQSNKAVGRHG